MAIAVETVPASPRQGNGIKARRFVAGSARIAVLPSASAASLAGFVRSTAKPGTRIITDRLFEEVAAQSELLPLAKPGLLALALVHQPILLQELRRARRRLSPLFDRPGRRQER